MKRATREGVGEAAPRGRLAVVDGLRGVAILMVLFRHTFAHTIAAPGYGMFFVGGGVPIFPFTHLSNTWMGVDLFFVDSGFVLFLPYALGTRAFSGARDVRDFYLRRAWRLLPLYYVMLAVYIGLDVVALHRIRSPALEIPAYVTFAFPFLGELWRPRMNPALWSIGVEVCFSAVFPLLALLALRIGVRRFLALCFAVTIAVRWAVTAHHLGDGTRASLNSIADSLLGRMHEFGLGMTAAWLHGRGSRLVRPAIALAGALGLFTVSAWLWDTLSVFPDAHPTTPIVGALLGGLSCFLALLAGLGSRGVLRRCLCFAPLRAAGIGCFSLYLVHGAVFWAASHVAGALSVPLAWAVCALVAAATYYLVERPGMERGRRVTRGVDAPRAQADPAEPAA